MLAGDSLNDRQAKPVAIATRSRQTHKRLEDPVAIVGGNAGSVVGHADHNPIGADGRVHRHLSVSQRRAGSILDEVGDSSGEVVGIASNRERPEQLQLDLQPGCAFPLAIHDALDKGRQIQIGLVARQGRIESRQAQQVVGEAAQTGSLASHPEFVELAVGARPGPA